MIFLLLSCIKSICYSCLLDDLPLWNSSEPEFFFVTLGLGIFTSCFGDLYSYFGGELLFSSWDERAYRMEEMSCPSGVLMRSTFSIVTTGLTACSSIKYSLARGILSSGASEAYLSYSLPST